MRALILQCDSPAVALWAGTGMVPRGLTHSQSWLLTGDTAALRSLTLPGIEVTLQYAKVLNSPFVNTVLGELGNEVQHSAYQERPKLRHISGKRTRHLVISTIPTSTGFHTANPKVCLP